MLSLTPSDNFEMDIGQIKIDLKHKRSKIMKQKCINIVILYLDHVLFQF